MNPSLLTIKLTHYDLGPIYVRIWEDATWWTRRRTWTCPDDPELGSFEDTDFEEAPGTIDRLLLAARDAASRPVEGVGHNADRLSSLA
jgi:hypothetical protein